MDPYSNLLSTVISGWSCNGNFDPAGKQKTPICLDNKNKKKRNLIYVLLPFTYVYKWVRNLCRNAHRKIIAFEYMYISYLRNSMPTQQSMGVHWQLLSSAGNSRSFVAKFIDSNVKSLYGVCKSCMFNHHKSVQNYNLNCLNKLILSTNNVQARI